MNVGKDPFPLDEVTGLAAFEHIEPLRSHSVVPEESVETPVVTSDSGEAESGLQARVPNNPGASNTQRGRVDATLPLNLSAMPHWQEPAAEVDDVDSDSFIEEGGDEELTQASSLDEAFEGGSAGPAPLQTASLDATLIGAATPAPDQISADVDADAAVSPPSALDAMFNEAAGAGWDDEDEATRVHSHPAGRAPIHAPLDMEWDEDEPATEMKPFALFDAPPLAARQDDHAEWNNVDDATSTYLPPRGGSGIRSATPTIRTVTPTLQTALPPVQARANALSGGRPSPFPASPLLAATESAIPVDRDERDEARASAFDGLVPVPAPELPLPATAGLSKPARAPQQRAAEPLPERFFDALKAGHRPSIVIAASGFVGLLALVLIVRALAAGGAGTAVLEVSPADAQVQVDGKAVSGTSSPYTVSELTPGNHEIVVKKAGYSDYRGTFPVTAGANTKLPVIELAANQRDVGFSVRSVPAGAAVWVDGEKTDQVTPAKLIGIQPGIHRLALKHEGFNDYELQMFVPEGTVLQLPAAELVALPVAPVEPARPGRRSRRAISADDAEPYTPRRTRRSEASESERPLRAERTSYTSNYGSRRTRAAESDDDLGRSSGPAADSGKTGTLRLNARPWAQVMLDGRPIGNTPQQNLQLSPGKHKLQLSNPQLGLTKSVTVNIKAGEILTQVVNLAE